MTEQISSPIATADGRTDNRAATDFVVRFADQLRYVPTWRKWLVWDGRRWKIDSDEIGVMRLARQYVESYWDDLKQFGPLLNPREFAAAAQWVRNTNQISRVEAITKLARCDQRIVVEHEHLNKQQNYLNLLNGTLDFANGMFHKHNPNDNITQLAKVEFDPTSTCPKWLETLSLVFDGDTEIIRYCQQLLGYSCTGICGEAILPVCFGSGANGKSTIWNTIVELLGDYGLAASDKLITGQSREHSTELANLYQRRFVAIAEPEENATLQEARVKALTGDSHITARRMREDFWTFERTHKFWIATNHLPKIIGTDEGIWRRVKVIPFTIDLRSKVANIPDFHKQLVRDEGSGIVNWLLEGYADYQHNGFVEPETVKAATAHFRQTSDELALFIEECLVVDHCARIRASEAYDRYRTWKGQDKQVMSVTKFGLEMGARFKKEKPNSGVYRKQVIYQGIGLPYNTL